MVRKVSWLVEDKVILSSIKGALEVEHFPELDANIIAMMETSTASQVHLLTDIAQMTTMPNIFQMTKLQYITHPKIGFFVTQGRNPVEQFIGQAVGQMLKTKYKFEINNDCCRIENELIQRIYDVREETMSSISE